jgi:hypothetical protein
MRKPLETLEITFVGWARLTSISKKALFTTKLHFFALYQQICTQQTGSQQIFTMKSTT